jgi:hypothetical protein
VKWGAEPSTLTRISASSRGDRQQQGWMLEWVLWPLWEIEALQDA